MATEARESETDATPTRFEAADDQQAHELQSEHEGQSRCQQECGDAAACVRRHDLLPGSGRASVHTFPSGEETVVPTPAPSPADTPCGVGAR